MLNGESPFKIFYNPLTTYLYHLILNAIACIFTIFNISYIILYKHFDSLADLITVYGIEVIFID